jgi:energy-coupling factor transporter transmembrane protein EcfT
MKINRTKNSGYLEGETALHKLKSKTKITASLFLILGSGICNRWALMGVGLLSVMGVFVAEFQLKNCISSGVWPVSISGSGAYYFKI